MRLTAHTTAPLLAASALALLLPLTVGAQSPREATRDALGIVVERGLGHGTPAAGPPMPPLRLGAGVTSSRLALLDAIARGYLGWGAVDDETHWAPWLCRLPRPAGLHASEVEGGAGHASKLYRLFASARGAYLRATGQPSARASEGLVVVKESFVAEAAPADAALHDDRERDGWSQRDGRWYRRGAFAGLFVMARVARDAPDADRGWLYATVSADGQVTAAGRIATCMGCHERAPHDRLFGLAPR